MSIRPFGFLTFILSALLAISSISCRNEQVFQVKGVVKEVLPERKRVKIEHEKIPNYMEAMTMIFDVKDAKELNGIEPGDKVSFRMIVTDKDGWIDQIKKIGVTNLTTIPLPQGLRVTREVDPLKEGDLMPNYHFTNELGQDVN